MTDSSEHEPDGALERSARDVLRSSEAQLGTDINQRLQRARMQAVAAAEGNDRQPDKLQSVLHAGRRWLFPLTGTVAVAVFAFVLMPRNPQEQMVPDDLEMAAVADMDMLEELEFVAWLEEEDPHAG